MMSSNEPTRIGNWTKDKVIGTGGFGTVVLWTNTLNGEELALKECRWGQDSLMTPKHRQRWKLEVDIMRRLNHPSVVKAIDVPPELDVPGSSLPVMAMEYCRGGDLRKTLNKPENCCGLPESQVRTVLRHIVSAVEYLHCMRIIHRDLKPENIVVQENNGKYLYKLIDLGYAKELDQGSLCTSFVGTLQYLAPELFISQTYSSSVDYWSLGLVAHEIITGQRPFLPTLSPAQWIPVVRHKTSNDIRAFLNEEGKVVFSNEICPCNQISRSYKESIEEWLRLLLEFDPENRGSRTNGLAFQIFSQIKDRKTMEIFCLQNCQTYSYVVNESISVSVIQEQLEKDTGIKVDHQLLLLPKGWPPDQNISSIQCWIEPEEDQNIVFLFNNSTSNPSFTPNIPRLMKSIMVNPNLQMNYENQKSAWRETVSFSQKQIALHYKLLQSCRISLLHLIRLNSALHKLFANAKYSMDKLSAKCDFFQTSLNHDMMKLTQEFKNSELSTKLLEEKWKNNLLLLNDFRQLEEKFSRIEKVVLDISNKAVEPQKSPYARPKYPNACEENHRSILMLYDQLRRRSREERRKSRDNSEMVELICSSFQCHETLFNDIYYHLRKIDHVKEDIFKNQPELEHVLSEIERTDQKILQNQIERQNDIWQLLNLKTKDSSVFADGFISLDIPREGAEGSENLLLPSFLEMSGGSMESLESFSSVLEHHTKDSQKVRKENITLRNELDSILSKLNMAEPIFKD